MRLSVIPEHKRYKRLGPVHGRLAWACSVEGLLDLISALPFPAALLLDEAPPMTWTRFPRLMKLAHADSLRRSVKVLFMVVWVNREILLTTATLVFYVLLVTSGLLWFSASEEES